MTETIKEKIDFAGICARNSLVEVAVKYGVSLKRTGREWTGCCPFHGENTGSFKISSGKGREHYHCYGCGAHGDVIAFVAQIRNVDMGAAARMLDGHDFTAPAKRANAPEKFKDESAADRTAKARALYLRAAPAEGSPVEDYLLSRGIDVAALGGVPKSLRFAEVDYWHPVPGKDKPEKIGQFPAMLAPIQQKDGAVSGIHITYLDATTYEKLRLEDPYEKGKFLNAKKVRGPMAGGCIRLAPVSEKIGLAEGIETGLSTRCATIGTKLDRPVWTCVSLGNLASIEFPAGVSDVTILGDNDMKVPKNERQRDPRVFLKECAMKIARRGIIVSIAWAPAGMDFNDRLRAGK